MPRYPEITSAEEFIGLGTSTDHADYDRSAWASMPLAVWSELLREHPDMRVWLTHNRTTPREILADLATDDNFRVRQRVAEKRSCPADILDQLCNDSDETVRNAPRRNRARRPPTDC